MNILEIDSRIKKHEIILKNLKEKRDLEITKIIKSLNDGDVFEIINENCHNYTNWKSYKVNQVRHNKVYYSLCNRHTNHFCSMETTSFKFCFNFLWENTDFRTKYKRGVNLNKLLIEK